FIGLVASVTLFSFELLLRIRYEEPMRQASPEVLAIQQYLQLDPDIGFVWKADIREEENIIFDVRDIDLPPLSTDVNGFINPPGSIQALERGDPVDVVGLGDSFMEHGAPVFRTLFQNAGFSYYSLAIQRQSPPQYLSILEKYAVPLRPNWVVLGLFENDFPETEDYDRWRESGMDWFAYHSGTWCGPPVPTDPLKSFYLDHFPGVDGLLRVLLGRLRIESISFSGPTEKQIERVVDLLAEIRQRTEAQGARFLLVLIPGRDTAIHGNSPASRAYDRIIEYFPTTSILDLRPVFASVPDPATLYYREDAHWNIHGIEKAGNAIVETIRESTPVDMSNYDSKTLLSAPLAMIGITSPSE
ncbi:MAG: hypothetical protein IIB38_01850, partial [Candidatus Hydrogenedentes bacterium]|nr:hypothetical protein [Candidatus Hydrogenedentota bacterium]